MCYRWNNSCHCAASSTDLTIQLTNMIKGDTFENKFEKQLVYKIKCDPSILRSNPCY